MTGRPVARAKLLEIAAHDIARGHASAGTVDPQHDGTIARIPRDGIELLTKGGDRVVARYQQAGHIRIEQQSVDIDQGDPRPLTRTGRHGHRADAGRILLRGEIGFDPAVGGRYGLGLCTQRRQLAQRSRVSEESAA